MSKKAAEHHRKASEHLKHAARHHQEAAKHHDACSCPPHRHGQHAGEIRFWSLSQERLALHHVVNGFGDIGRMIAHALKILRTKHQVRAEGHRDGVFHHISEKLLR